MTKGQTDRERFDREYEAFVAKADPVDTPLAEYHERLEKRPGLLLREVWGDYQIAWISSIGWFRWTLAWFLAWHLRMLPWKIFGLRNDFLSKKEDAVSSDGFWLRIQRLAEKDTRLGCRLQKFWQKVFKPWEGRGAHVGPCRVISSQQSRLDFALSFAGLREDVARHSGGQEP